MCTVSFLSERAESYTTITYLDIKLRRNFLKVFFSFLILMNVSSYHQTDHKHENISSLILFNSQQENRLIHKFCGALSLSIIPHGRCRMQVNGERKVAEIIELGFGCGLDRAMHGQNHLPPITISHSITCQKPTNSLTNHTQITN